MKMVIVDDEKGIVDGLNKLIGRYVPECEMIGAAYNGLDGFRLILERQPDIVITDIRMPQADGLEMIRMLKDEACHAKFILLSGYAEFEYARKGMQLGVQFYINKPVEEEELQDCVYKVMEVIRSERARQQEVHNLKLQVHNRMVESALRDLMDAGSDNKLLVDELLRVIRIPLEDTRYVCALLEFESSLGALKGPGLERLFLRIDRTLEQYQGVYRIRYSGSQVAVMVTHDQDIKYRELIRSIHDLKEMVYEETKLSMAVGIGTVQERAEGISLSFEEARHALSYKVIKGEDAVIPYSEIVNLKGRRLPVSEEIISKLEACMDNMDEKGCVNLIREIFGIIEKEESMSPADLQLQCLSILLSSMRKMSLQQFQQHDIIGRHILSLESISRFRTLEQLEEWMVQVIQGILSFKQEHQIPRKKDIIAEIKEYVTEHYSEPISLADLSARFFINPYYLSQLFKQKTGETYLNFLAQTRINKAKELLIRTDLKVYEICQRVGYSDAQHFARLFEKLTGCKPSEYRKNPLRE
ncbi:helix-turn-helix domain-containing protein [Paenibacillus jiagnxiensis]|uniref:helix-turn-helix domain-containing protein n=1 Tax=Paenibacillus jiagnxiensis TaxID=3228926 RepID=UPI0033A4A165